MNLTKLNFQEYKAPDYDLLGYKTFGRLNRTDPEVDSAYISLFYYYFAKIAGAYDDYSGKSLQKGYNDSIEFFKHSEGIYRRFPRAGQNQKESLPEALFSDPRNLSRDNTTPIIITLGEFHKYNEVLSAYKQLLKRCSFFQNTHTFDGKKKLLPDLATPDHHAMYLRSIFQARLDEITDIPNIIVLFFLYPVLCFFDVFGAFSMLLHVLHTRFIRPDHTGSELNHIAICVQRARVLQTPFGILANFIYKFRANMPAYGEKSAIMNSVFEFFTRGTRANIMPPLDELSRIAVGIYLDEDALK
jgi:hypothetical protein